MRSPGTIGDHEAAVAGKLTKRTVDAAAALESRYILWDSELKGFGLRVEASGTKTYLVRYRPKDGGSQAPKRFVTIGRHGVLTPDQARERAKELLGAVANGADPAQDRQTAKGRITIRALWEEYERLHVRVKVKPGTQGLYEITFRLYVLPALGDRKAEEVRRADITLLHAELASKLHTGNRVIGYLSALYNWAGKNGFVPEDFNPAKGVERYSEPKRERYLGVDELDRLGAAIREAETVGIPWEVDESSPTAKHTPKSDKRQTPISPQAAAALRLLLFTGARLREILNLKWQHIDFERAALFLPDSKTGRKTIYLNGPALAVLQGLPRVNSYVFPGTARGKSSGKAEEQPRSDLKRPWEGIRRMAGLNDVRLHDLRHTHASFGVGGGLGLPVIAKLLGHTQMRTTERYSHLDADPIRRASESIGRRIADAMGEGGTRDDAGSVVPVRGRSR